MNITTKAKPIPPEAYRTAKQDGFAIWEDKSLTGPRVDVVNTAKITPMLLPKKPAELEPVQVHAQNVHDYFIRHHKEHHWEDLGSFTCARPAFPKTLITYDHCFTMTPDGKKAHNIRHIGVMVTERTPEYFEYYLKPEANPTGYDPKLAEKGRRELLDLVANAHPSIFLEMMMSTEGRAVPGRWFVMLDAMGAVIIYPPFGYIVINSPLELNYLNEIGMAEELQEDFLAKHGAIALAVLQFMNCRNVEVLDNPPTRQQRRGAERQGQRPPVTYKTLMIHPIGKRRAKGTSSEPTGIEVALHICRGHFKDYRQGGGLGKWHRHGLWWWAPQVRGHAERGRVVKDYDVEVEK